MHELTELQLYQHLAAAWPTTAAERQKTVLTAAAESDCIPAGTMAAIPAIYILMHCLTHCLLAYNNNSKFNKLRSFSFTYNRS